MKSFTLYATALVMASAVSAVRTSIGCYSVSNGATFKEAMKYNSIGSCGDACLQNAVFAMSNQTDCYCGDKIPADQDKASDDKCAAKCPGYDKDTCGGFNGGIQYFSFYDSGIATNIPKAAPNVTNAANPSATTSTKPSVVTAPAQTVLVTSSSSPTNTNSSSSSGPSKAGIAAGVVIGIVAIAGICGGLYFFLRNRKRRAIEEEHRRNAEINKFTKPPTSSGATSFTDTRLDPIMANRRMSDGSIADNQDYSRRILKVTNA